MSLPPKPLSSVLSSSSTTASSQLASSDLTGVFLSMSVPATRQLKLLDRTVSSLTNLRYENATSRAATAVELTDIQAELGRVGPSLTSIRAPGGLAQLAAAQARTIQQLNATIGELAGVLTAEPSARSARLELARARAQQLRGEAESLKSAANATAAQLGVAAAAVAAIPIVGPVIAAILAAVAAVMALIGTIVEKSKEQEAAAGRKERVQLNSGTSSRGVRWPP